jgi:hypothetical protein
MTKSNSSAIALLFLLGIGAAGALAVRASAGEPVIHVESGVAAQRAAGDSQNDSAKPGAKSITGRLVDEAGQPIPNAGVFLRKVGPPSGPSRSIGTDEDGRFHSDDLAAGSYMVLTSAPGYVPATEEREYYRPGDAVNIRMIKGGVITGTVTNSSGEPVVGVRITTLRVRDGESRPIRGANQSVAPRQTDDRGVYRVYGLLPGAYLVVASGGDQMSYASTAYDTEVPTFYPSTTRDAAGEVVVRAGHEVGGIDIRYRGDRGFIVSGTLSGALGEDSLGMRGVVVSLAHRSSGAVESRTFVQLRVGKSFAVYGVPDGDYDLVAQMDVGRENSAASAPRHVVVKGADVTGIDLSLAPLGSIAGRAVLEKIPAAERTPDCKVTRITSLEELVIMARRDEKTGPKSLPGVGIAALFDGSPDEKGEFKVSSLANGRYRIEMRLPSDDWFVKAMTRGAPAAKQSDAASGLVISTSQRVTDLTVTLGEGAASLRGKVVAASEGARLPALQVHLVPAETEAVDDVIRFAEVRADSEGAFSLSNIAPGRYYLLARAVPEDQIMERNPQPLALDVASRAKLRRESQAANVVVELQRCQRISSYALKYAPKK